METYRNEQTDSEQTDKIYKITPEKIPMYIHHIFTYIGLYIQVRDTIILHYLSYIYNKYLNYLRKNIMFYTAFVTLTVSVSNFT